MANSLELLDQALEMGRRELETLTSGEVDGTDVSSLERGRLLEQAWEMRHCVDLDAFQKKLLQLQSLQGELTTEARKLHASLKEDMKHIKAQGRRMAGYGQAARMTPRAGTSRFLSRHG